MNVLEAYGILAQIYSYARACSTHEPTVFPPYQKQACYAEKMEFIERRNRAMERAQEALKVLRKKVDIPDHWITADPYVSPRISQDELDNYCLHYDINNPNEVQSILDQIRVRMFDLQIDHESAVSSEDAIPDANTEVPEHLRKNLSGLSLQLVLFLWSGSLVDFDRLKEAVWPDKVIQDRSVEKAIERANKHLEELQEPYQIRTKDAQFYLDKPTDS